MIALPTDEVYISFVAYLKLYLTIFDLKLKICPSVLIKLRKNDHY